MSLGYIAFGKNGMWAVADYTNHCVYTFDGQDQLIRKVINCGSEYPHGVTFDTVIIIYMWQNIEETG